MTHSSVLIELVIVLGSAAFATVLFQALRLPVVLGYVLAGLLIGPHVPIPLVANPSLIEVLSELGVILLMFTIGLELPLNKLARVGTSAALTALFEVALVVAVGTLVARLLGLHAPIAVFAGACLGISSTMLVAKAFDELNLKGGFTEIVFAILVFEDLIAIVLLAIVTAVAGGAGLDAVALATMLAKLGGFLVLMLLVGLLIVPRTIGWIATRARRETLLIASLLLCFGVSALAAGAGYSVALGAFLAGVMIAQSGQGHAVFALVESFRDVFAMVFFVSVGLSIEPQLLAEQWLPILAFTAVVILFKPLGVAVGVFASGHGVLSGVRSGLSLAQIGEFSFVIAGVVGDPSLLAIAVGVSCVTTLTSPALIGRSAGIAAATARRLPRHLAIFVSFYEGWLGRMRTRATSPWQQHRRSVLILAFDAIAIIAIAIAGSTIGADLLVDAGVDGTVFQVGVVGLASLPFALSIVRRASSLAHQLAVEMIPAGETGQSRVRNALVVTLETVIALVIAVPIVATIQPFVPGSFALLLIVGLVLMVAARRSMAGFEDHVQASSQALIDLLARPVVVEGAKTEDAAVPGFPGTRSIAIPLAAGAVGRSLADLDVRARTGAMVLAIVRGDGGVTTPSATEPLQPGDVLAVAGSDEAIDAARELLSAAPEPAEAGV